MGIGDNQILSKQISKHFFEIFVYVNSLIGQIQVGWVGWEEYGRFPETGLGEKERARWDLEEQMLLIRDQKKNRNNSTPPLPFVRPHYK